MGGAVLGGLAAARAPVVADQPLLGVELGQVEQLALLRDGPPHDQRQPSVVAGRLAHAVHPGVERRPVAVVLLVWVQRVVCSACAPSSARNAATSSGAIV